MSPLVGIVIVIILIAANGFFVATEFALVSSRATRIDQLAAAGNRAARLVQSAKDNPTRFISGTQLGVTVASLLLGAIGEETFAAIVQPVLDEILILFGQDPASPGQITTTAHAIASVVALLGITFFHIALGEQVPKILALQRAEPFILLAVQPVTVWAWIFRPFISLLYLFTNLVLRAIGLEYRGGEQAVHSPEELQLLVTQTARAGLLSAPERELVQRAFTFSDQTAGEVMVPRTEIIALPIDSTVQDALRVAQRYRHTRFPVFEKTIDNVVGILSTKDLLGLAARRAPRPGLNDTNLRRLVRPPLVVPQGASVIEVLARMKAARQPMAVVLDEFGGTAGIVTLKDLVARLLGDVGDEYTPANQEVRTLTDGTIVADGLALVEDVNSQLGTHFDASEVDSLGGLVFSELGRRPVVGDEVELDGGYKARVERLDGLRIARVRLLPPKGVSPNGVPPGNSIERMVLKSINPTTEDVVETFEEFSDAQIDAALQQAFDAQRRWRLTSFGERSARLQSAARVLRAQKAHLAALATREMGKPIVEAEAEVEKCAYNCDYYAEHAATFLADEHAEMNLSDSFVAFEPLGVVLAIMPWNFPFWQVFRFAAPALMAGNGAVLKHASNVPSCALAIEDVLRSAGLPDGLLRTVLVPGSGVEPLIGDPRIAAVTLTGSSDVGERVASTAGRHLKKQVLELGGSDPFIVLADADIDAAVKVAVRARNQNNGQSCIAAKRFIVEAAAADEFTAKFAATVKALHVGDPMQRETNVGPLARGDLRDTLATQVERSLKAGAHAVAGGSSLDGKGYFYAPTVLDGVSEDMPAFREETFGPVAAVIRARDPQDAVRLANDTEYGLGAALWTADVERAKALARHIEAGSVFINGMVASDPRIPFGGIKRSGYGRELGAYGIKEFTNIQTVVVGQPVAPAPPAE